MGLTMSTKRDGPGSGRDGQAPQHKADDKARRLAEALRQNLRRRKVQARARAAGAGSGVASGVGDESANDDQG